MELLQELSLTAFVAVLFSFLVAKLVSVAMSRDAVHDSKLKLSNKAVCEEIIMEELHYNQKHTVQCFESENKTEILNEPVDKVDRFDEEHLQLHQIQESEEGVKEIETECSELPIINTSEQATVDETGEIDLETDDLIDETIEVDATVIKLGCDSDFIQTSEEAEVAESDSEGKDNEEKDIEIDDDDWEGIEKSELEKVFTAAANFVGTENKDRLAHLRSDVEMEMYGLHKIATEGTCHEPQPMVFKVSARAKWNVWQRLGSMSPETAMERYIEHLSEQVPGWMEENPTYKSELETSEAGIGINTSPKTSTFSAHQLEFPTERTLEMKPCTEGGCTTGGSKIDNMAKE